MVLIEGEEYGGLIADQPRESDWRVGSVIDWESIAPPHTTWRDHKHVYDQDRIGPNSCTLATACGCYTDATGVVFEYETLQTWYKEATELPHRPLDPAIGRWVGDAFAFVGNKQGDMSRAMLKLGSDDYYIALEKGFSLSTGYGGNRAYNIDRNEDSILQSNDRGSANYHHCIRHVLTDEKKTILIPDNYPKRASNVYRNPEIDKKIQESGNYFTRGYFYFQKTTLPMAKLPVHLSKEEATSPETREIIIARENEISAWLDQGGDPVQLYKDYTGEHAITRMLIDLKWVRGNH